MRRRADPGPKGCAGKGEHLLVGAGGSGRGKCLQSDPSDPVTPATGAGCWAVLSSRCRVGRAYPLSSRENSRTGPWHRG